MCSKGHQCFFQLPAASLTRFRGDSIRISSYTTLSHGLLGHSQPSHSLDAPCSLQIYHHEEDTGRKERDERDERAIMARKKDLVPMVNWVYDLILWGMSVLVDLFFREVHPRGSWKVPRRGPVIFVAAPHANQVSRLLAVLGTLTDYGSSSILSS